MSEGLPRLVLFGTPTASAGGRSHALPAERRSQLLVLLALRRAWVPRSEIAALLWPEQEVPLAQANLRKTLLRLQSFAWAGGLESQGGSLRYVPPTDVAEFEAAVAAGDTAKVLSLYRGELLAGFDDASSDGWTRWLGFERERLRTAWRRAALAEVAGSSPAAAVALAARLLEVDPLDEAALIAYLDALRADGQASAARQAYRQYTDRLASELGIEPGAALRELHENALAGDADVPLAAPERTPRVDDSFVGRTVERQRIAALLARAECRLLCLIGPGGIGKTRLARRAVEELAGAHADGAHFVPLEDVDTPAAAALRIGAPLGVTRAGRTDPLAPLIEALRPLDTLLVLDNFEQLADHASLLDRLLDACPRLKLMVTSRTRLPLAAAWSVPLEGLPVPEPEDADVADSFDAFRLFVQAAQRAEPGFSPQTARVDAEAIVDICRRVDGLPLANELAAAWVRVLPCAGIAQELAQGTELLGGIEQVFERSWSRLVPAEQRALSRLSLFRGTFDAEAARAVAGASLPILGALVDKSLLRRGDDPQARLQLHPLVQQLAAGRLADADRARTEAAHATHFLQLLTTLGRRVQHGDRAAVRAIERDFEDMGQAWTHAIDHGPLDALLAAESPLIDYLDHRGRYADGLALVRRAVDSPRIAGHPALHARLRARIAHFDYRLDRYDIADAEAARVLEVTAGSDELATRNQALLVRASCALRREQLEDARRWYQQSLDEGAPGTHAHNLAVTLDHLSLIEKRLGHFDEALRLSMQSLVQHRAIGDTAGLALCLNNLAALHQQRGEYAAAAGYLRESLALCERDGYTPTLAYVHANLAEVALRTGDATTAARHAEHALAVGRAIGNRAMVCWCLLQLACTAARAGDLVQARQGLAEGAAEAIALGSPAMKGSAVMAFAELAQALGDLVTARRALRFLAEEPTLSEGDRVEVRRELASRPAPDPPDPPWHGPPLDDFLHRLVAEREVEHGPLLAFLRTPPNPS